MHKCLVVSRVNSAAADEAHNAEDDVDLGWPKVQSGACTKKKARTKLQRRQGNPTHCNNQERAKQQCADSSTASGGGYPLAPPRSQTGIRVEAVKQNFRAACVFLQEYNNVQPKGQTGKARRETQSREKATERQTMCELLRVHARLSVTALRAGKAD